ncbi:MAG: DUF3489 domain-containing protein [Rubritepida sp.]|nr:DUF3489 domain-containing protein [Rubritepida sp.]
MTFSSGHFAGNATSPKRCQPAGSSSSTACRPRPARESGTPRQATKQEAVLTLLRRLQGATIAQIMEGTGWQQHTVRGFFAGLKKRQSINVEVLGRVRQVGPGAQGSRGLHSVFRVAAGA